MLYIYSFCQWKSLNVNFQNFNSVEWKNKWIYFPLNLKFLHFFCNKRWTSSCSSHYLVAASSGPTPENSDHVATAILVLSLFNWELGTKQVEKRESYVSIWILKNEAINWYCLHLHFFAVELYIIFCSRKLVSRNILAKRILYYLKNLLEIKKEHNN